MSRIDGEALSSVHALVTEVERLDLDGVDVDLEGNGSLDADRAAFVRFMRDLSTQLQPAEFVCVRP